MDKSNTDNGFSSNISFFIQRRTSSDLNKEQDITTKLIVSVWFIHFSTYFIIFSDSPKSIINIYIYIPDIGLVVRVFTNGPGDLGSIPGRVIPKTQKTVLDASLLNPQHYKVRIKGKVEQSREGVAPSPTPWCSSYRKGNLRVTLDYGRQLYFTYIYIYIYIYMCVCVCVCVYKNETNSLKHMPCQWGFAEE